MNGAGVTYFGTIRTFPAFLTPQLNGKITAVTFWAVRTLLFCALDAHFSAFLVGASVTDLIAAIAAFSAFKTKVNTCVAFVTLVAIGRAVDQILTIGTAMRRKNCQCRYWYHTNDHNKC